VYYVQQKMSEKGVDLFLDIHGDEEIPHSFIMSAGSGCKTNRQVKRFKMILITIPFLTKTLAIVVVKVLAVVPSL
jgi:hypothetical protein